MSQNISQYVRTRLQHPTMLKLISFGVIGIVNAAVDFGVFTIAYEVFALPIVPSNVAAWLVAVTCSYVMNTMITFRTESGRVLRWRDYFKFATSGVLGMIANTATVLILANLIPVYAAKLAAIVASFIVNFTMSHFVVFRSKPIPVQDVEH